MCFQPKSRKSSWFPRKWCQRNSGKQLFCLKILYRTLVKFSWNIIKFFIIIEFTLNHLRSANMFETVQQFNILVEMTVIIVNLFIFRRNIQNQKKEMCVLFLINVCFESCQFLFQTTLIKHFWKRFLNCPTNWNLIELLLLWLLQIQKCQLIADNVLIFKDGWNWHWTKQM